MMKAEIEKTDNGHTLTFDESEYDITFDIETQEDIEGDGRETFSAWAVNIEIDFMPIDYSTIGIEFYEQIVDYCNTYAEENFNR